MFRMITLYPASPGKRFDFDYYRSKHLPMVWQLLEPLGCQRIEVDRGVEGLQPGQGPSYVAVCHIQMESLERFQAGVTSIGSKILADHPNYTDIEPEHQMGESFEVASKGWGLRR